MDKKTVTRIVQGRATKAGHAVELDITFVDETVATLEIPSERLALFSGAIYNVGAIAERMRKAQPGQEISADVAYFATAVRTDSSVDGRFVLLRCPTTMGTPVHLAMTPELAREAIERLQKELAGLDKRPPFVRS